MLVTAIDWHMLPYRCLEQPKQPSNQQPSIIKLIDNIFVYSVAGVFSKVLKYIFIGCLVVKWLEPLISLGKIDNQRAQPTSNQDWLVAIKGGVRLHFSFLPPHYWADSMPFVARPPRQSLLNFLASNGAY